MSNDEIAELRWENGQLGMHGFGAGASNKGPTWDTLESVVQQGTIGNKVNLGPHSGLVKKRRTRSESDQHCQVKLLNDQDWGDVSVCASANAAFCRRTISTNWAASHDSSRSTRTKTTDDDSACNAVSLRATTKSETEPSQSHSGRKGRAAAVHNQSERRRRDRINQKMKALQKLVPNASKTDKASMLDEVIDYLKQLQTQVQLMSARSMMMPLPLQHQLQMSILARAGMGVGLGMGVGPMLNFNNVSSSAHQQHIASLIHPTPSVSTNASAFVNPPLLLPQQPKPDPAKTTLLPLHHPYNPFLGQSINMDMYNRMAALYGQQMNQTTKPTTNMQFNSTHQA